LSFQYTALSASYGSLFPEKSANIILPLNNGRSNWRESSRPC